MPKIELNKQEENDILDYVAFNQDYYGTQLTMNTKLDDIRNSMAIDFNARHMDDDAKLDTTVYPKSNHFMEVSLSSIKEQIIDDFTKSIAQYVFVLLLKKYFPQAAKNVYKDSRDNAEFKGLLMKSDNDAPLENEFIQFIDGKELIDSSKPQKVMEYIQMWWDYISPNLSIKDYQKSKNDIALEKYCVSTHSYLENFLNSYNARKKSSNMLVFSHSGNSYLSPINYVDSFIFYLQNKYGYNIKKSKNSVFDYRAGFVKGQNSDVKIIINSDKRINQIYITSRDSLYIQTNDKKDADIILDAFNVYKEQLCLINLKENYISSRDDYKLTIYRLDGYEHPRNIINNLNAFIKFINEHYGFNIRLISSSALNSIVFGNLIGSDAEHGIESVEFNSSMRLVFKTLDKQTAQKLDDIFSSLK